MNTTSNTTESQINSQYAVEMSQGGQRYPALQASTYQPRSLSEQVSLVLSEDSFELLDEEQSQLLNGEFSTAAYGGDDVAVLTLPDTVQFTILALPRMFKYNKADGVVSRLGKGEKLKEMGCVTTARLLLAAIVEGQPILDADGNIQIFTLKLRSSTTQLIGSDRDKSDLKTIYKLNSSLQEHYKLKKAWLCHLVSIQIAVEPEKWTSTISKESSLGIKFVLKGNARVLSDNVQKQVFEFISTDEFKTPAVDPFRLNQQAQSVEARQLKGLWESADDQNVNYDDIPFRTAKL